MAEETKETKTKKTPEERREAKKELLLTIGIFLAILLCIFVGLKIGLGILGTVLFFLGVR